MNLFKASLVYTASSGDSQGDLLKRRGEWADMVKAGVGSEVGRGLFHEAINQESDALEGGEPGDEERY